jgi:hypothetical protein
MDIIKDFTENEDKEIVKKMIEYVDYLLTTELGNDLLNNSSEFQNEKEAYDSIYKLVLTGYNYNNNHKDLINFRKEIDKANKMNIE